MDLFPLFVALQCPQHPVELADDYCNVSGVAVIGAVFLIMLVVYCYIAVTVIQLKKKRQIQLGARPGKRINKKEKRLAPSNNARRIFVTLLLLGSFSILWLPTQVYNALQMTPMGDKSETLVSRLLIVISSLTAWVDIIIYICRSREALRIGRHCLFGCSGSPMGSTPPKISINNSMGNTDNNHLGSKPLLDTTSL